MIKRNISIDHITGRHILQPLCKQQSVTYFRTCFSSCSASANSLCMDSRMSAISRLLRLCSATMSALSLQVCHACQFEWQNIASMAINMRRVTNNEPSTLCLEMYVTDACRIGAAIPTLASVAFFTSAKRSSQLLLYYCDYYQIKFIQARF